TWIAFALVGAAAAVVTFFTPMNAIRNGIWSLYFILLILEVIRLERKSPTRTEGGMRPLLVGMTVLQVAIVLQMLVVAGIIPWGFPWGNVYYVGLIALAIGSSLFTVNTFALTRRRLERNEGEIESARKLQEAMLPKELPAVEGIDVAAWLSTASEVGGDYYDFHEPPDGGLLVVIGDAAGHGLAAGAMVTAIKALFGGVRGDEELAEFLTRTDAVLRRMDLRLLHMCLSLVRVTGSTIEVCSAAMPPALIRRASTGAVEELGTGGLPLGGRLRGSWESQRAELLPGDTVLLASDGLAELLDPMGEPFGFEEVGVMLGRVGEGSAQKTLDRITTEAATWQAGAPQADDITLVVLAVRP
ncbi:MAG: PP2C family protein-serine/threonine phosphatase, partial [Thermoanaerobaculia bacterium]